jgi:3-deoxy-D-manno-octulosonic-acid transferase
MILFFYNVGLFLALVFGAPWWLFRMATTRRYREGLWQRLGHVPPDLARDPALTSDRQLIWLHAVSVGEVLAVTRLVKALEVALPSHEIVISTTTRTGQALARERFGDKRVFYCPLDLPWAARSYLDALRPALLILAETEFWPNLLNGCFRRGIPVAVVNARISDRSWPRYRSLRCLWRPILRRLDRVLAQSQTDADRLLAIGCDPEAVSVSGNLKFDVRVVDEAEATRRLKFVAGGLRFVVAGSTLEGEEDVLLAEWPRFLAANPRLAMILAPRHPERFDAVAALLEKSRKLWCRRSDWTSRPARPLRPGEIVLLDTIGELASVYSLASVAFVGGSLVPAGGHNPLEPAQFGVPIVMGPHYENFAAITESLRQADALRIADAEDLATALIGLINDRALAVAMGARAIEVFERQAGATERCVAAICKLLGVNTAGERTP